MPIFNPIQEPKQPTIQIFSPGGELSQNTYSNSNKFAPPPTIAPIQSKATEKQNKFAPPPSIAPIQSKATEKQNKFAPPPEIKINTPISQNKFDTQNNQLQKSPISSLPINIPQYQTPQYKPKDIGFPRSSTLMNVNQEINSSKHKISHSASQPSNIGKSCFPFSIRRKPVFEFGFGGLILQSNNDLSVNVESINTLYPNLPVVQQLSLFSGATQKADINNFIDSRIKACESANEALLWAVIKVRLEHDQQILPQKFNANAKIAGSPEYLLIQQVTQGLQNTNLVSPTFLSKETSQQTIDQLQSIIVEKGEQDALEFAINNKIWSIALVIANAISPIEYKRVSTMFVKESISPSPLYNILSTLTCVSRDLTKESWEEVLSTTLRQFTNNSIPSLQKMAEYLESIDKIIPSHICRLLASEQLGKISEHFSLVGTDWLHPSISSIQMSQLSSKTSLNFYPYALYYTMALIDYGFTDKAQINNARLHERFEREHIHSFLQVSGSIQKKLELISSKKTQEGIMKSIMANLDKALTGLVHGTEEQKPDEIEHSTLPGSDSIIFDSYSQVDDFEDNIDPSPLSSPPPKNQTTPQNTKIFNPNEEKPKEQKIEKKNEEKEVEKEPKKSGWFGSFVSKLNPFSRKTTVVVLPEEEVEYVFENGHYVIKGASVETPPPPPPKAKIQNPITKPENKIESSSPPPPSSSHPPPPAQHSNPIRSGSRIRSSGRYVQSF